MPVSSSLTSFGSALVAIELDMLIVVMAMSIDLSLDMTGCILIMLQMYRINQVVAGFNNEFVGGWLFFYFLRL